MYKLISVLALAIASVPALALPVLGETQANGYTIHTCSMDDDPFFTFDYCTDSATKAYDKYSTPEMSVFNDKYAIIAFKVKKGDRWYGNYALSNVYKKEVYPFPFVVSKDDGAKNFKSIISKNNDSICFPPTYNLIGNELIGELGGLSGQKGKKLCFKFAPAFEYNFELMPTVEDL